MTRAEVVEEGVSLRVGAAVLVEFPWIKVVGAKGKLVKFQTGGEKGLLSSESCAGGVSLKGQFLVLLGKDFYFHEGPVSLVLVDCFEGAELTTFKVVGTRVFNESVSAVFFVEKVGVFVPVAALNRFF